MANNREAVLPRVGVMGAGSIGCYLGGVLAMHHVATVLVGRARIKTELEASGLAVVPLDGNEHRVDPAAFRYSSDPTDLANCDIVLVAVKSGASAEAARVLAEIVPRTSVVVSMQNGLHNAQTLQSGMPHHKVLAGIVGFNVVAKSGGVFKQATSGEIVIELANDPRIAKLAELLRSAGLSVLLRNDVRALQWSKLVLNLNNAIGALSDVPTSQLLLDAGYRRVLRSIITEALAIMRAADVVTARLGPMPVSLFPLVLALPTPLLRVVLKAQLRVDQDARSSMWSDLVQYRKTEVEELNGEIVRLAASIGRDAPINRRVVEVVHETERRRSGSPRMSADQLARTLGI